MTALFNTLKQTDKKVIFFFTFKMTCNFLSQLEAFGLRNNKSQIIMVSYCKEGNLNFEITSCPAKRSLGRNECSLNLPQTCMTLYVNCILSEFIFSNKK